MARPSTGMAPRVRRSPRARTASRPESPDDEPGSHERPLGEDQAGRLGRLGAAPRFGHRRSGRLDRGATRAPGDARRSSPDHRGRADRSASGWRPARLREPRDRSERRPQDPQHGRGHEHSSRGRHGCRRGVHGRALVEPGPCPARQGRLGQPRIARADQRVVANPRQGREDDRPPRSTEHPRPGEPQHRRALRPRQRVLPALPRRDDDVFERRLREPDQSLADAQRNKYRRIAEGAGSSPASTSSRSAPAGAASPCTPRGRSAVA